MYAPTQLFWYRPIFMTELILAEALFVVRLKRRRGFWWKLLLSLIFLYGIAFAMPIVSYDAVWCSILFSLFYLASLGALFFCFKESIINVIFSSIAGYTLQHIAFQMYDLLSQLFNIQVSGGVYSDMLASTGYAPFTSPASMLLYLVCFVGVYWLYYLIFGTRIKKDVELQLKSNNIMIFIAGMILVDIVLSSFVTYYSYKNEDTFYTSMLAVSNILLCTVLLLYQFELPIRKGIEKELDIVYGMLDQERKQYETVKNNIDLVNRKCHDLKYHIRQIGAEGKIDAETLEEIDNAISIYGTTIKTGNEALDTILTEKSLFCYRNGISLSCIADGKSLSFMKDADIYVLFGNAIDNAIEAVTGLDEDKRVIGISIKPVKDFIAVNIHNYFANEIVFEGNIPKTTKSDKFSHGFGISSMQTICAKYGGDMVIKAKNGVFNLNIMFFVKEKGIYDK